MVLPAWQQTFPLSGIENGMEDRDTTRAKSDTAEVLWGGLKAYVALSLGGQPPFSPHASLETSTMHF